MQTTTPPVEAALSQRKACFWNRIARKYARDPVADLAGYEKTLARVQSLLSPEHDVLEIGCGTGSTALRLAPLTRRLVATDLSEEMLAIARAKQLASPVPQLGFRLADADDPLGHDGEYDVVLAFNLLHLVSDLPQTLGAIAGVLKPGGLFVSKTPCLAEMNPLIPRLLLPLMRAIGKAPHVLCFDTAHLRAALEQQGFVVESVERHASRGRDTRPFIVARKPDLAA